MYKAVNFNKNIILLLVPFRKFARCEEILAMVGT